MDKITYLAELAEGLARWVPERERQDILRYYAEYLEEAGPEREAEVIAELGDPWALSCRLAVEGGFVTQEKADAWKPRQSKRKVWPFVLAGTLAAVVIVAVSVASLASRVGGFVGQFVGRGMVQAVTVEEGTDYASFDDPEYTSGAEAYGGFWSMEDGCLEAFGTIDADISLGNVTVTGGEDYTLSIQQDSYLGGYTVKWEVRNGALKLRDSGTGYNVGLDGLGDLFGGDAVDVIVTVPDTEHLDRLTVKTDLGGVFLSQLFVEGDVLAESDMGDVECYEVRTMKKLSLTADVGDVTLGIERLYSGMEMELESNVGGVEASLGCREAECGYQLETDVGTVVVNGRDCGTKAEHKAGTALCGLDAQSDVGDINVYFHED